MDDRGVKGARPVGSSERDRLLFSSVTMTQEQLRARVDASRLRMRESEKLIQETRTIVTQLRKDGMLPD